MLLMDLDACQFVYHQLLVCFACLLFHAQLSVEIGSSVQLNWVE